MKMKKNKIFFSLLILYLLQTTTAHAYGSLRCKGQLIDIGDSASEVLSLCGNPTERIVTEIPLRAGNVTGLTRTIGFTTSERLIYDRGWGKSTVVLHVDAGRIQRIEYLPRGEQVE
jgi:hypothetical protein